MSRFQTVAPELSEKDRLVGQFQCLLTGCDFAVETDVIGVGALLFSRKKRILFECQALYTALWKLSLDKTFPLVSGRVFGEFLDQFPKVAKGQARDAQAFKKSTFLYLQSIYEREDADFTPPAERLANRFELQNSKRAVLKLALNLRRVYTYIFDGLV